MTVYDPDHSLDGYIDVGMSHRSRLLMVALSERGNRFRIISARQLTRAERKAYEEYQTDMDDELRSEYDIRDLLKDGVRGKYAEQYRAGANLVLLDQDVAEAFPNDQAVNDALRLVLQLTKIPGAKEQAL